VVALPLLTTGGWQLKQYWLSSTESNPDVEMIAKAGELVGPAIVGAPGHGAGFVIVHRGEQATWVIVWWWSDADILRRRIWQLAEDGPLEVSADHIVACVWELSIVDWERKAWINHVLRRPGRGGRTGAGYLEAIYPSAFC
jgi:hypothetical protein